MPAFRGPDGRVVYVPEEEASRYRTGGDYQEIGGEAAGAAQSKIAPVDNGVLGSIGATVSGALSGATLGASDWLLKGVLDKGQFEQLAQDRADNPILAGTAQAAGMMVPALLTGGAATPAGALGKLAAEGIEAGRATGGVLGAVQQLGAGAAEGAIANAGIYLSDVALGDRKLTAEGINGALGTGLLFGAAGIPVAHGIETGTIAARRMFARYAEGGAQAASDAAAVWTEQAGKHLEAFDQAADLAKARLAETQTARETANLEWLRASAEMADARAFTPSQEFPGGPAAAPEAAGAAGPAGGAGQAAAPGVPVPGEPPEVTAARALRDRAKGMGGEPITPEEIAAIEAKIGKRTYSSRGSAPPPDTAAPPIGTPNALEQLAQQPGVVTAGPATSVREFGARAVPITADEAELGARLAEYQDARRAFDEIHAQVDPDLDAILRGIDLDAGDLVGVGGVPVAEFGKPWARGFKSQEELARLASGTDAEAAAREIRDLTAGRAARAEAGTSVLAKGTRPRSLGEVAAEQAPVSVEQPAAAVGKRPAQAQISANSPGGRIEVHEIGRTEEMRATMPDGSTRDLGKGGADAFLAEQMPAGFHPAKVRTHQSFAVEHGLPATAADVAKIDENAIYVARPSELADRDLWGGELKDANRDSVLDAWKQGKKLAPVDAYVTPDGRIYIEDGNHRVQAAARDGDRPVAIRFKDGTNYDPQRSAREIGDRIREDLSKGEGAATQPATPAGRQLASDDEFRAMQQDLRAKLTPDEIKQSIRFSREYYMDVNRALRKNRVPLDPQAADEITPVMDRVMDKAVIDEPIVTHRGFPNTSGQDLSPGAVLYDPGFGSTSWTDHKINRFGKVHLVITSPSGTHIAAIPSSAAEGELTLARGTSMRVTSHVEHPDGTVTVHATVFKQDAYGPIGEASASKPAAVMAGDHVAAPAENAGPLEIRRVGRGSKATFEAKMPDGSTRTLADRGEVTDLVNSQLPAGFQHGPLLETHRDLAIERGLPKDVAGIRDNALYVAKPSELADHGIMGNDIHPEHAASMAEARATGVKLEPIEIKVTPDGKYWLEEGNHRLNEAAKSDAPVAIKFKAVSEKFERQKGTYDISDRIRGAMPKNEGASAHAGDDLLAALSGTKGAIDKGAELADIGGKEAAATRAEQLARRPETAERFLRKAGASDAADAVRAKATGSDLDAFFRDLTAPKTRDAYVAQNIGRAMREEGSHAAALAKVEREWAERAATEAWAERAAVLEYEGGYSRAEAERIARDEAGNAARGPGAESPPVWESKKNPSRVEAAKKAAAASVERLHEIHSAVASNLPQELQTAWNEEGYKFLRDESARIRGVKDRINAASKISEAFTEKYGSASETGRGYEGDRFYRRSEIEAKHAESWADEQERKYYGAAAREGHPLDVKRLEMAHDDALERAATAADPAERAAAAQEAKAIEKQITQVGARPGAVEDIAAIAPAVTRIEKAAAALTEALGDIAPAAAKEHAAAFRAAEDEASRKTTARIGQAADDAAGSRAAAQNRDPLAPPARAAGDDLVLGPSQKQQRIAAAQKSQREAAAAYAKARVAEAEAQIGAKQAAGAAAEARAKLGPPPEALGAAPAGGLGHRVLAGAHAVGYAAELGSDLGIPGIPRPHDIPVIGPLLSAYLKYRALRAAAGRFVGRVPATAETRAAAIAARTRDGVARSVDRSLGLVERNTNAVRVALTVGTLKATDALGQRLVDDGQPDAPAKASLSEQAAVRMREVAAVVANPALVQAAIRVQGRALTDPDLIDALSNHLLTMFRHLNEVAPKGPPPNPFTGKAWTPPPAEAIRWGQQLAIARDPQVAFQMLEAGTLTPAGADTMRRCYELLFRDGQARVIQRASDLKNPVDYTQLIRLGRLFDIPLHPSQDPQHAAVLAGAHTPAAKPLPSGPAAGGPPTPSIANPTTVSSLYDAGGARRAGRI